MKIKTQNITILPLSGLKSAIIILLVISTTFSCNFFEKPLFIALESNQTYIDFNNSLKETETENVLSYEYFYNGGGVGASDFNNDGLVDLFFTGNQVGNELYLNKGELKFEKITKKAGVSKPNGAWATGVSVVDINADGWLDIYVCYSGLRGDLLRKNQLFINKGLQNVSPEFTEQAEAYGLADSGYSSQAIFLDYDRDGDLDCFLVNHNLAGYERKEAHVMRAAYDYNAGDKLFRNNGNNTFTDVTLLAGIKANPLGFGLGVTFSDINNDGYPDIFVANDFVEDDYLYINQQNGTFKDQMRGNLEHTSYSSMGVDIADINNDLLPDILTTDMLPEDNARQKLLVWPDNWNVYQAQLNNGFWHGNMRNMLQINNGNGTFSEIGQLAGISNTDWSWAGLIQDFDLDKNKDIFVSNGIGRDFTNIDFIKYSSEIHRPTGMLLDELKKMTESKTGNYIFRNNGNTTFSDARKDWGFEDLTISNGAITADLDNDGDFEIITNNLNQAARIYKNNLQENKPVNFVKIRLKGNTKNTFGVGAKVILREKGSQQSVEFNPARGYLSSSYSDLVIGCGEKNPTIEVIWPNGNIKTYNIKINQLNLVEENLGQNAKMPDSQQNTIFENDSTLLNFKVETGYHNDFEKQLLIPQHYSYFGPKLSKSDVNLDGYEDLLVAGTEFSPSSLFLGSKKGDFLKSNNVSFEKANVQDIKTADFNGDQYPDLYFAIGDYSETNPDLQNDQIWLNDGKGGFKKKIILNDGIHNRTVEIVDFDKNGKPDVFLGGFVKPYTFPVAEPSMVYFNKGNDVFESKKVAFEGLVTASIKLADNKILVVGEWMAPTILEWNSGELKINNQGISDNLEGWWNCVKSGDLDGDGDLDLVLGNIGRNVQFKASPEEPAALVFSDFDQNGQIDPFMEYYIQGTAYPPYSRDEVTDQIPLLRRKFHTYKSFSTAILSDFFEKNQLESAQRQQIKETETLILENQNGKYIIHRLPIEAQYSSVFDILIEDFNHDHKKDILLVGNNSKMRLRMGKIDANFGQMFLQKNKLQFDFVESLKSGLKLKGDVKSVVKIGNRIIFGINNRKTEVYSLR